MKYDVVLEHECPICGKVIKYDESLCGCMYHKNKPVAMRTYDCHGIPFRMVCVKCYEKIMETKGYDGEYYDELDEVLDYDY